MAVVELIENDYGRREEKETRAAMVFGRCFENALGAFFHQEDSAATLFKEWGAFRDTPFDYKKGDSWDRVIHQGVHLLETFARDNRVSVHEPHTNLQVKVVRTLTGGNEFVAYIDALGEIDGRRCLIDWKTTTSRYPDDPIELLSLDPQLVCYPRGSSELSMSRLWCSCENTNPKSNI